MKEKYTKVKGQLKKDLRRNIVAARQTGGGPAPPPFNIRELTTGLKAFAQKIEKRVDGREALDGDGDQMSGPETSASEPMTAKENQTERSVEVDTAFLNLSPGTVQILTDSVDFQVVLQSDGNSLSSEA